MSTRLLSPAAPPAGECLALVRRRNVGWYKLGVALGVARDRKLYAPFPTFAAFVRAELGFTSRRAEQFIEAARTADAIARAYPQTVVASNRNHFSEARNPLAIKAPRTERQLRIFSKLPPELRAEAWARACRIARGRPPSARIAAQAVSEHLREHGRQVDGAAADLRDNWAINATYADLGDLRRRLGKRPVTAIAGRFWRRHRRAGLAQVRWAAAYFAELKEEIEKHHET